MTTKYVVLHNSPDGLVMSQGHRDGLFSTGNVIHVAECSTYSLQPQYIDRIAFHGRGDGDVEIVLWGMEDRYGVAPVPVFMTRTYGDAHSYCEGLRPTVEERFEDGTPRYTVWRKPEEAPK